jgi:hypothetical protein
MQTNTIVKISAAITYVAMILVNVLANALPINGIDTGQISDNYGNLFAPAGLTFSIWGLIYLLLGLYTLYQFGIFQKDKGVSREGLFQKIGVLFIITSLLNILWIFSWHYDYIGLSVLLMTGLLTSLIAIANYLNVQKFSPKEKLFILAPFSVYFGWITVATIANITVFLVSVGWGGWGISAPVWTATIIAVGAIIGIIRMLKDENLIYGSVFIWAYLGILLKHVSDVGFAGQYPIIIASSIIWIIAIVVASVYIYFQKPSVSNS